MSCLDRCTHESLPRVADPRGARVGDDRNGPAGVQHLEHLTGGCVLGVVVDPSQAPGCHPGVLEQSSRAPGVLAAHEVRGGKRLDGSRGEVTQVADGCGNEQQGSHDQSRTSTMSPMCRSQRANEPACASMTVRDPMTGAATRCFCIRAILITVPS
uniref:Unannotated protein n=1 Tax=freshwater metagenome TaxID=449393 RepID=A0A6J7N2E9_9ZZZZ